jgi:Fe-S-cluster containining protein
MKPPRDPQPQIPVDEKLCNNCGKCCYKKILVGRTVYITPFPCEFLDTATNLCTIYDRRKELNPLCLSVPEGMTVSAFPSDCPYVPIHAPKNYRAAVEHDFSGEWDDFDGLADDLDVSPEMREKVRARGPHAPPMYVEANAARVPLLADLARTSGSRQDADLNVKKPKARESRPT